MAKQKTAIIIPAYNEGPVVADTINKIPREFSMVVCVNDGSTDETASVVSATRAALINHPINLGQGAAIQTGIEYALQDPEVQYFVTFDADGQHDIEDVKKMLEVIEDKNLDIVLGSRFLGETENLDPIKRIVLKAAIRFSNATSGLHLTDAHNGLRVFNRKFAGNLNIVMSDMAHASEIINKIAAGGFRYAEVPVIIRYTDYSRQKGQSVMNAVNIMFDLLLNRITRR